MLKKIESVRSKPKEVRNRYAFWYAFSFTAVVVIFWLTTIPSRLTVLTNSETEVPSEIQGGVSRSFSDLRASIANGAAMFSKIKEGAVPVDAELPQSKEGEIDFSTFFSTSTDAVPEKNVPKNRGKSVLIGTTSQARSSSTDN